MVTGRSQKGVRLRQFGLEVEYEVLATNQFSSERKRMSVLVRTPAEKVVLFCKGADEVMLPLLTDKEEVRMLISVVFPVLSFLRQFHR